MTIKKITLLLAVASTILYSCTKNDTDPNYEDNTNALEGTYDFVGMTATATTTETTTKTDSSFTNKTVVIAYYNTKNNEGTVVVDDTSFNVTGMDYRIDTTVRIMTYKRDVLESDVKGPFIGAIPKSDIHAPYKLIGTDSIFYKRGFIDSPDGTGIGQDSDPNGYKFSWSGDTLILTAPAIARDKAYPGSNTIIERIVVALQTVKLKKRK